MFRSVLELQLFSVQQLSNFRVQFNKTQPDARDLNYVFHVIKHGLLLPMCTVYRRKTTCTAGLVLAETHPVHRETSLARG